MKPSSFFAAGTAALGLSTVTGSALRSVSQTNTATKSLRDTSYHPSSAVISSTAGQSSDSQPSPFAQSWRKPAPSIGSETTVDPRAVAVIVPAVILIISGSDGESSTNAGTQKGAGRWWAAGAGAAAAVAAYGLSS